MKKLLTISAVAALGLSSVAFAGGLPEVMPEAPMAVSSDAGFYLGISGGWGLTNWRNLDGVFSAVGLTGDKVEKDNGFVGRAFIGYDFNRYFAAELGYTYFFNKPNLDLAGVDTNFVKNTSAVDLMGKIKAPVADNLDLYAKLGANYLMTKFDNNMSSHDNFNVAYGAGVDYMITPNVIANVEWLRFNGHSRLNVNDYQPYTDAFLVGLRYKFDM